MENICTLNSVVLSMYYSVLRGKKQAHFPAFHTFFRIFPGKKPQKELPGGFVRTAAKKRMRAARTRGMRLSPCCARQAGFGIDKATGFA
ncbi:MAG: hypothetical protein E7444_00115 [Ruminococcaceae bacterium]|nr:hypothetical protein [Oscillospiraceae bacterium]